MRVLRRSGVPPLILGLVLSLFLVSTGLAHQHQNSTAIGLTDRMRRISKNLDVQLNRMMSEHAIKYTYVNTTRLPFNASAKFHPKGMGELYNFTNIFIDLIFSKQLYPEGKVFIYYNMLYYLLFIVSKIFSLSI